MRSSTYAILSLPRKYRVPLRRKRSLDSARDDGTRDGLSYISSHPAAGANLRPFGAPPSKGRREKSQSLPLEGKCVSNRWKMRVPLSPYCHFERSEKSSLHTGQTKDVRGEGNTVLHTTWNDGPPHMCRFPACKKDPSATLGMTIREDGRSHIRFHSFT